jgi:hypothetical protein
VTATNLLEQIVASLDASGIPHMLVGSFASTSYSSPRSTQDIDVVIDPSAAALARFIALLDPNRYYVDSTTQEALAARDQFNVVDVTTGWKVDLVIRKDRPFSRSEFDRRVRTVVLGVDLYVATAEDTVLAKLEWAAMGGSDRQVADAAAVLAVQGDRIDHEYLDRWASELGVVDLLERARQG